MKAFATLIATLGTTTKTNEKVQVLEAYFLQASNEDKIWVIALFSGKRPKRSISSTLLKGWCAEQVNIPAWLFDESYHTVGDLSETIALLLNKTETETSDGKPLHYYIEKFIEIEKDPEQVKKDFMLHCWQTLATKDELFVFNKLLSGTFRIGVSQQLMVKALAKVTGMDTSVIAHRIIGNWSPQNTTFDTLMNASDSSYELSKPYPFCLAYPLEGEPETLGSIADWQAEWKWDGIRGQLIKRSNTFFLWSRGEELITDRFPEYKSIFDALPDNVVIDGEIIAADKATPLPFALLQKRIGRKNVSNKLMTEAPVSFFAYDLLEYNGEDLRQQPLQQRRALLKEIVAICNNPLLHTSPEVVCQTWAQLAQERTKSRDQMAEGFMLKRKDSTYQTGRKRGSWYKWKIDALTIDAVMIYAQKGSGKRSNLYTDYTFAVKDGDKLVSFAKAYSGLTDAEIAKVDNFVKRNAIEKFGPVRTVKPELVFEIAFEGIAASNRHKSGVALRFPRMSRWRHDKKVDDINTLEDLKAMLAVYGNGTV